MIEIFNNLNKKSYFKICFILIILLKLFSVSDCLYADQIGKFDWRHSYIGKINYGFFDNLSNDKIIVATESNVLSVLDAKSGAIIWRQIFEKGSKGQLQFVGLNGDSKNFIGSSSTADIVTVSGHNPAIIRNWNSNTGNLVSEWYIIPTIEKPDSAFWYQHDNNLYHVYPVWKSHFEITEYNPLTGDHVKTTTKILAPWISQESCVYAKPFFACLLGTNLVAIDLTPGVDHQINKPLREQYANIDSVKGLEGHIKLDNTIISLKKDGQAINVDAKSILFNDKSFVNNKNILLQAHVEQNELKIVSHVVEDNKPFADISYTTQYPESLGQPDIIAVKCKSKHDSTIACRLLLTTSDGALVLLQQGKIKWVREESLSNIVATEMIDLPLSDDEGAIEKELNSSKEGDILGACFRRLSSQVMHFKNILLHLLGLGLPPSASQRAGLIRDAFGLHKIIVVLTSTGKLFGIDNVSGKYHWKIYLPEFGKFENDQPMKILVQRTSKHFPNQAQCVIVAKNPRTRNGIIYQFNPITGQQIDGGLQHLNYEIQQLSLLHNTGSDFLHGILILDSVNNVHVIPESAKPFANNFYLFSANKKTGDVSGFVVKHTNNVLSTVKTWKINVSGIGNSQKIIAVATKNSNEHVHSQGRVLGDRSVLYKYINPNLAAIATFGPDSIHKFVLNVHLIDTVSGLVVFSFTHKRIKDPFHMIHSENWLVYSYYNEKIRRTEITTIELYEGKTQTNSTVWSSLDAPPTPIVARQAYVFPTNIASLKETVTEKGITNKHVLIGLSSGGVVEMPWTLLDPRRPITQPNQVREEGVIPYLPEIPIPEDNIINHNQSIPYIKGIHTAASGLESTCLVFVHGLDLFVTRVAPSKTFDLLKDDFDYFLISVVLIALTFSSYVVKQLSSRKTLKQAWK